MVGWARQARWERPDEARRKVIAVANEVPQLSVLGVAGPGDACYDWRKTQATFAAISKEIPDIKLCISTNGLALPEHIDELAAMNVDHVTITINMVDPEIGAKIYPGFFTATSAGMGWKARKSCTDVRERPGQGGRVTMLARMRIEVRSLPSPALLGKGARSAGWGMARCFDPSRIAQAPPRTRIEPYLLSTPHPALWAAFPAHMGSFELRKLCAPSSGKAIEASLCSTVATIPSSRPEAQRSAARKRGQGWPSGHRRRRREAALTTRARR